MLRSLTAFLFGACICGTAVGQEPPDDAALRQAVETAIPEAQTFARELEAAIGAAQAEADAIARSALRAPPELGASIKDSSVDLDRLLGEHLPALEEARAGGGAPTFFAFVSLSLPPQSLGPLLRDVAEAGGVAVLRGFKDGSIKATAAALEPLADGPEALGGAMVDPRLFRSFNVRSVPTFVMAAGALGECGEPNCVAPAPPHDRIAGNVTVAYALRQLAEGGDAAPEAARWHLNRLETRP